MALKAGSRIVCIFLNGSIECAGGGQYISGCTRKCSLKAKGVRAQQRKLARICKQGASRAIA
jgi:hypothetical protein